jgi:hypothetical protein
MVRGAAEFFRFRSDESWIAGNVRDLSSGRLLIRFDRSLDSWLTGTASMRCAWIQTPC